MTEDFRRHPYWCPRGHPEGKRRLDVFFDHCAFPVWGRAVVPPRGKQPARVVYGMAQPTSLGISARLAEDLQAWADWQDAHAEHGGRRPASADEHSAHWEQGRLLAGQLARETGAEVLFGGVQASDRDPECPHCGD